MNRSFRTFFPVSGIVFAAVCFIALNLLDSSSQAAVPQPQAEQFVNALVNSENGANYPDIAIYYLETINKDGTIPAEYKSIYDMEMGRLHMLNSNIQPSLDDRLNEIEAAHESYAKFIKENPNHPRIRECASQYASLMMARGTIYRDLSVKSTNKKQEQRDEWMKTSRESFIAAQKEFLANQERAKAVVKKFQQEKKESGEEYEEAITDFLQAWLAVAGAYYEIAQTYPVDSKEYKDFLEKSRKEYNIIFTKYGSIEPPYIAGLYARVREGRIMMDQGIFEDPNKMDKGALSIFDETLTLDNNEANRIMRDEALLYYLQSAVKYKNDKDPKKKEQILDQAWTKFNDWYRTDGKRTRQGELVPLQILLASCNVAVDKVSGLTDEQKKEPQNKQITKTALDNLDFLFRTQQFKDDAIAVKSKLGFDTQIEKVPREKMSFEDLNKELDQIREGFSTVHDSLSSTQPEELPKVQKELKAKGDEFLEVYNLLEGKLSDDKLTENKITTTDNKKPTALDKTDLQKLNSNRYLAAYIYFLKRDLDKLDVDPQKVDVKEIEKQNVNKAIKIADKVVQNYPTDPINEGMASLESSILRQRLVTVIQDWRNKNKSDPDYKDTQKAIATYIQVLERLAKTIKKRNENKESDLPDVIWSNVCDSYIDIGNTAKAEESLQEISENAEKRADCEIRIGNMLWNNYLQGKLADIESRPSEAVLKGYKEKSEAILQNGIDRMKKSMKPGEEPSRNLVSAAYTLANQKLSSRNDAEGALELLNDADFGPLTLVKKDSELVKNNELDIRTLQTALKAYVSIEEFDEAEEVMKMLEKCIEQSDSLSTQNISKEDRLSNIYMKFGKELKENLVVLTRDGQKEKADKLVKGFEVFLDKIVNLPNVKYSQMAWVAQTFNSLGETEKDQNKGLNEKAKGFYGKAIETYENILKKLSDDPGFVSQDVQKVIRYNQERLAVCYFHSEQFEEAIKRMGELLSKTPNQRELQIEAVRCYQKWGEATADPDKAATYLKKSLVGCGKDFVTSGQKDPKQNGKAAIWGWNTLANKMQDVLIKKKSEDVNVANTYFEARLTISQIYVKQAEGLSDESKKKARLQDAEKVLLNTHRTFPTLKDDETFEKFDQQLRLVRTRMHALDSKVAVEGFSELETAMGFANKGDFKEAISRIKTLLSKTDDPLEIDNMQIILSDCFYRWGERTQKQSVDAWLQEKQKAGQKVKNASEPEKAKIEEAKMLYNCCLNGSSKFVNKSGKPAFNGLVGLVKQDTVVDANGEPLKHQLITYLQARLSIAETKFNLAMLEIAAVQPKEEAPAPEENAEVKEDSAAKEEPAETNNQAEEAKSSEEPQDAPVSEGTSDDTSVNDESADQAAQASENESVSEEAKPSEEESSQTTQTSDNASPETAEADQAAKQKLPQKAQELLQEVKAMIWEDYKKFKTVKSEVEIMGNASILQSYETLLRRVQEQLGEPVCGFAKPESLLPKQDEQEEAPEEPTNPMLVYGILGGIGVLGLIIIIIAFLPKKKKLVEKQKVNVTDGGIAIGSEKFEEKVDLGFAQEEGEVQKKIDLGFGGFNADQSAEPKNKVDLGLGGPQQDVAFNFDFSKKPAPQGPAGKPALRPAGQQPTGKPAPRPAGQQPAGKPAPRPAGQHPAGKPAPRPAGQQPAGKPEGQHPATKPQNPNDQK